MGQEITTTQKGNQVIDDLDPDALTEEELAAQEAERLMPETARLAAEAEAKRLAEEAAAAEAAAAEAAKPKERPIEQLHGELARLREERERLRSDRELAKREADQLREENARWKAKQELEAEAQRKLDDIRTKASRPDPEVDPYGAELWDLKQWKQAKEVEDNERRKLEAENAEREKEQKARTAIYQEHDKFLVDDVRQFTEEKPDYADAANFVSKAFLTMYQKSGYTEDEARVMLANNLYANAAAAKERKQSVAKAIYETAEGLGWKPKAAAPPEKVPETTNGAKPAADKIKTIKRAQALSGLGGKDPADRGGADNILSMSAEDIANMDDDLYLEMQQDPVKGKLLARRIAELG